MFTSDDEDGFVMFISLVELIREFCISNYLGV